MHDHPRRWDFAEWRYERERRKARIEQWKDRFKYAGRIAFIIALVILFALYELLKHLCYAFGPKFPMKPPPKTVADYDKDLGKEGMTREGIPSWFLSELDRQRDPYSYPTHRPANAENTPESPPTKKEENNHEQHQDQ